MTDNETPAVQTGPRIPRREAWIDLPAEYAGFKVRAWVNAPAGVWDAMTSGDEGRMIAALSTVVLEHNGWLDFNGEPYSQPSEPVFWKVIPTELTAVLMTVIQAEMQKLPKSIAAQKRR